MSQYTQPTLLSTFFSNYPGKALWTIFALSVNAIRLPLWMIFYIPSFTRPHTRWTWKQAVRVRIVRAFLWNASITEMKTPLSLKPGKEGDRFVVLSPAKKEAYIGEVVQDPMINPVKTGVTWYPRAPSSTDALSLKAKKQHVILHFHGGAYAIGDGRTDDAGFASKTFIENTSAAFVCAPQYRLASNPGCRFPAQLQDAITSYAALLDLGVQPSDIILSGDSAGANLALALVKYLTVYGSQTGLTVNGLPSAAWLWSCWTNPLKSIELGESALDTVANKKRDYVGGGFGLWGAKCMIPSKTSGLDISSPWINFGGNPFKTDIPLYVSTGECEVLFSDDVQIYEEFSKIEGNRVGFQIEEDCVHDVILVSLIPEM